MKFFSMSLVRRAVSVSEATTPFLKIQRSINSNFAGSLLVGNSVFTAGETEEKNQRDTEIVRVAGLDISTPLVTTEHVLRERAALSFSKDKTAQWWSRMMLHQRVHLACN